MKTLFITKPFFIEPLGLMYLSAAAKKEGHEVDLITTEENLEKKVQEFNPEILGFSVMTGDHNLYLEINNQLKQKFDFFSLFGGPHPTFFPNFIEEENVDAICRGEGEEAFVELLNNLELSKSISNIANMYVKSDEGIQKNMQRELTEIDTIAFPDREIVFKYPHIGDEGPIKHFLAARGCPFSCSYCFNDSYSELYNGKGRRVRFRDPEKVVDEVEEVINLSPTKFVYFQDDTFTLNKGWLRRFTEEYASRIELPYHCHVRPNTVDKERIKWLKDSGCYSVHIAAETANDNLRNKILIRNMDKKSIIGASHLLKDAGIKLMLQNIIGIPTGTIEDDIATLELNIECKPDYGWVSIFQPYPGTALGQMCEREEYYNGDYSDVGSNFFDRSVINFSSEYKNQLANLQKLFAIFVEYPELHRLGLSRSMINVSAEEHQETYTQAYKEFRKKGDERLFGFEL